MRACESIGALPLRFECFNEILRRLFKLLLERLDLDIHLGKLVHHFGDGSQLVQGHQLGVRVGSLVAGIYVHEFVVATVHRCHVVDPAKFIFETLSCCFVEHLLLFVVAPSLHLRGNGRSLELLNLLLDLRQGSWS